MKRTVWMVPVAVLCAAGPAVAPDRKGQPVNAGEPKGSTDARVRA